MINRELRGYVQRLYKYKSISDRQFSNAVNNLEQLRESDPYFYYFNMGKLHSLFGNPNDALSYLEQALVLKPENPTCYYNMYKCYVKKGDFAKAYEVLNGFVFYNEKEVDFSFPLDLLNSIKSLDEGFLTYLYNYSSIIPNTKCGFNDLSDNPELTRLYNEVIMAYNKKDFKDALSKLKRMDYIIREKNYPMEVDTLIALVQAVKEKEAKYYMSGLTEDSLKNEDYIVYSDYCLRLYELGKYDQESFFRKIQDIIESGALDSASYLLDTISERNDFENYLDVVEYLRGFVREKKAFNRLSEEEQKDFTSKRLHAKSKYKKKLNQACLDEYTALKEEYGLPICDYYIAKVMFRMGMFSQAKEMFLSYLEQGGVKTEKAYMFLAKIEKIKKNIPESKRYIKMMKKIHRVFPRDFEFLTDKLYGKKKKVKVEDDKLDQHDEVKKKKSRNIRMDEADFERKENDDVLDFYDASLDGKLAIIRGLLQTGHESVANKLFEEVQRECAPEERGKVKQFERNRKIYKNQNRTGSS